MFPKCSLSWRTAGIILGWFGVLLEIFFIVMLVYGALFYSADGNLYELIFFGFFMALNLLSSINWLYGIIKKKTLFMLASLAWWGLLIMILLIFMLFLLASAISTIIDGQTDFVIHLMVAHNRAFIYVPLVGIMAYYSIAVMSYISVRDSIRKPDVEMQHFDISYSNIYTAKENTVENAPYITLYNTSLS